MPVNCKNTAWEEKMEQKKILETVDHTLLKPDAVWEEIQVLCDEAMLYGTASVCIPPSYVKRAKEYMGNRMAVCTVIGFPNGYNTAEVKVFETKKAIEEGADEIDMVINIGDLKAGREENILEEIRAVKKACEGRILKVIIETCLLTDEEKKTMCRIVADAGADYIKTSTGFSTGGATFEDVELFARHVGNRVKIKAAGGISTLKDAERFLELGASRLGTSRIIKLIKEEEAAGSGEWTEKRKKELIRKAISVVGDAYAPYSRFHVAAALLCGDGSVYTGVNIENSSYPAGTCAERTALFTAVSEGKRDFCAIVIVGGAEGEIKDYCPPCGICRQAMREFTNPESFRVILARSEEDYKEYTLKELLPQSFGPENLYNRKKGVVQNEDV